ALLLGALASLVCYAAVQFKGRLGYDDSLDAFGVHGIGGILGALMVGLLAFTPVEGGLQQLGKQAIGVAVAIAFAGGGTFVLATLLKALWGLRIAEGEEREGMDLHVHGERGYHFDQV